MPETPPAPAGADAAAPAPSWTQRLSWVGLAFVPVGLITAFTVHVTTDVASAPLLWVIPLALYLLTFVLVFRDPPLISRESLLFLHLVALVVIAFIALSQTQARQLVRHQLPPASPCSSPRRCWPTARSTRRVPRRAT